MNSIVELDKYRDEELRHMRTMREWNARERDRKEWAWEQRIAQDEARETERIRHENLMAERAPLHTFLKAGAKVLWWAGFGFTLWMILHLNGYGAASWKAECLRDLAACELAVKGGAK